MAGSYNHLISGGESPTEFSMELIENLGDAHGALEECWFGIEVLRARLGLSQADVDELIGTAMQKAEAEEERADRKSVDAAEWHSIEDELPELNVDVLTTILEPSFTQPWHMHVAHVDHLPHHWSGGRRVTHWMPLPEPPEASE